MSIAQVSSSPPSLVGLLMLTCAACTASGLDDDGTPDVAVQAAQAEVCSPPNKEDRTYRAGDRILSIGTTRYRLLSATDGSLVASGAILSSDLRRTRPSFAALAGPLFTVVTPARAVELRNASNGELIKQLNGALSPFAFVAAGVAEDGSYGWSLSSSLTVVAANGAQVLSLNPFDESDSIVALPRELRVVSTPDTPSMRVVDLDERSVRSFAPTGALPKWFEDGSYFVTGVGGRYMFYTPKNALTDDVTFPYADGPILDGAYGQYYWVSWSEHARQDFFRVNGPRDAARAPVPALSLRLADWGTPPRNDLRAHRVVASQHGSVAVFDDDPSRFWLADLRGAAPTLKRIAVPEPMAGHTFASDVDGRWAVVAKSGRLYASAPDAPETARALGCGQS